MIVDEGRLTQLARRLLGAAACLTLAAGGLVACATRDKPESTPGPGGATPTTALPTTVASPPATAAPGTTAPVTTAAPSPTTVAPLPETSAGYPPAAYDAWTRGDRVAAARFAEPAAVDALFARTWSSADGWAFVNCQGAAGSVFCTWQRPGEELLIKAHNAPGGQPADEVIFRASP